VFQMELGLPFACFLSSEIPIPNNFLKNALPFCARCELQIAAVTTLLRQVNSDNYGCTDLRWHVRNLHVRAVNEDLTWAMGCPRSG
jgi:hypothetical protein